MGEIPQNPRTCLNRPEDSTEKLPRSLSFSGPSQVILIKSACSRLRFFPAPVILLPPGLQTRPCVCLSVPLAGLFTVAYQQGKIYLNQTK